MKKIIERKILKKIYNCCSRNKVIGLIFVIMLTVTDAHPLFRRSTTGQRLAPCFVLEKEGNRVHEPVEDTIFDLTNRTNGAMITPKKIQTFIREKVLLLPAEIPNGNFISLNDIVAPKPAKSLKKTDMVNILNAHYSLLYKLVSFIEYARKNDKIASEMGTDTLKDKLKVCEDEIYQIMCDIKIALIGQGSNAGSISNPHPVSPEFIAAGTSYYNETRRVYVVMNDFKDIMEYLNKTYTAIRTSLKTNPLV